MVSMLAVAATTAFAGSDTDHDGVSDAREAVLGTDPTAWDTDRDGVSDGAEVLLLGGDPLADDGRACAQWTGAPVLAHSTEQPLASADFDGDGDLDVLLDQGTEIAWVENTGGAFGASHPVDRLNWAVISLAAADLDGDGDADVVAGQPVNDEITWWQNLGGGSFGPSQLVSASQTYPGWVVAADFDGDGDLDLSAGSYLDDVVAWYENVGGAFGAMQVISTSGDGPLDGAAVDVDGDGDEDLLAQSYYDGELSLYENLGGGSFGAAQIIAVLHNSVDDFDVGDLDADGDPDVVVRTWMGLHSFENLGGGSFGPAEAVPTVGRPQSLVLADLDLDGDVDAVLGTPDGFDWYERTGASSWGPPRGVARTAGAAGSSLAFDVDLDGDPDVIGAEKTELDWYVNRVGLLVRAPDDDGIPTAIEQCLVGTDPEVDDTDGGGVPDGLELLFLADPLDPTDDLTPPDSDHDGLADRAEVWWYGTDPHHADPDRDGLDDSAELHFATDPFDDDTDDDGAADGAEVLVLGTSPLVDDAAACAGTQTALSVLASSTPQALAGADFDQDGDADLLAGTSSYLFDKVTWWENLGGGVFAAEVALSYSGGRPDWLLVPDVDGDGDPDVITASNSDEEVAWYENLGGSLGNHRVIESFVGGGPNGIASADLDGDGDVDVVIARAVDNSVGWYSNLGGGMFGPRQFIDSGLVGASTPLVADFDGDGDPDVAASTSASGSSWYENLGGGVFSLAKALSTWACYAVDLDGDGDSDLLGMDIANQQRTTLTENLGGGAFGPAATVGFFYGCPSAIADLDADGDPDLLSKGSQLWWLENDGNLTFSAQELLSGLPTAAELALLDVDGDGDLDPAWATGWLENTVADVDADGLPEATEVCISATDPLVADSDGGGTKDGRELSDLTDPTDPTDDRVSLGLGAPVPGAALAQSNWTINRAVPGASVRLFRGKSPGSTAVPACPGLSLALAAATVVDSAVADPSGVAVVQGYLPGSGAEVWFQAVDLAGCVASDPQAVTPP